MEKKENKKGYCDKFNKSLEDISVYGDTYMDILNYLESDSLAQMRWDDISNSPDRKSFIRFLTKYVDTKLDEGRKKANIYKAVIAVLAGTIGIGVAGYAIESLNTDCSNYYKNTYGPQGTKATDIKPNQNINMSYDGHSVISIKLNNDDQYYSGSVISIREVKTGIMKFCNISDASQPLSVTVDSGEYEITLLTLPNGDYCDNVYKVAIGEDDFVEVNVVAGYQSQEDREKVYSKK